MLIKLDEFITPNNHFKWKEALFLNSLNCYHSPSREEVENIIKTCSKLDKFREYINKPFKVNCWIRPTSVNDETNKNTGVNYNKLIRWSYIIFPYKWISCRFPYSRIEPRSINEVNFS